MENTLAYFTTVTSYNCKMIYSRAHLSDTPKISISATPGACTIKHYRFVIYRKWAFYSQSFSLACTNTLAYFGIRKRKKEKKKERTMEKKKVCVGVCVCRYVCV